MDGVDVVGVGLVEPDDGVGLLEVGIGWVESSDPTQLQTEIAFQGFAGVPEAIGVPFNIELTWVPGAPLRRVKSTQILEKVPFERLAFCPCQLKSRS